MNIDLREFCSDKNGDRRDIPIILSMPWSGENHTYYSDGVIMIRCKKNDVPENLSQEQTYVHETKFTIMLEAAAKESYLGFLPLPELPPAVPCAICKGKGWVIVAVFPECGGKGDLLFQNQFSDYEIECKSCYGDGEIRGVGVASYRKICGRCCGSGFGGDKYAGIKIGDISFAINQLRRIAKLSGVMIKPHEERLGLIRFDGGDGIIMPLNE